MRTLYALAGLWLCSSIAVAQNLKGRVTDSEGNGLPGVSVVVVGSSQGTVTNAEGNFSMQLRQGNYKIRFSFVGYKAIEESVSIGSEPVKLEIKLEEDIVSLSDVVVLGSRSTAIRTNVETPVPVDVITMKDLQVTGQIEPTQMMHMSAPSYNSSRQTIADGTDHIDPATLRGLGPDQVLMLLNGKRRHNQALTNVNGTVGRGSVGTDLNAIPAAGIERIEVLRDGAASQYGSDAIAGVINVVMKKEAGTNVNAHWGRHYAGDGRNLMLGVYHGIKVGQRGTISVAGDFRFREPTNRVGDYQGPVYINWNTGTDIARRQQLYDQDQALIAQRGFSRSKNMQIGNSKIDNFGGMLNGELRIGPKTNFYFTGLVNFRKGQAAGFYRYPFQTSQVNLDLYPNGFLPQIHSTIWDRSLLVGVSGEFGNGWRWDLSNVYGGNSFRFDVKNSNNASQFALGARAQTEFYCGTLRFNQNTADFGISKDFGKQLGLKTFNVASGLHFRIDQYGIEAGEEASWRNYDPASGRAGGAQVFPGFQPANEINLSRNVLGAYVDLESDITEKLLLNVAGRFENYSDFGSNFAGKFSARYKFADVFSLRGAISNGFRAPSVHQSGFSAISTVFISVPGEGLQPRQQGTFRNGSPVANAFGIPKLKAETSVNMSIGATSQITENISLTIDAYQIDIKDRIVLTGQFQRGTSPTGQLISQILDRAGQREVNAAVFFTNAINTRTQGLDVVLSGNQPIGKGTLNFTLACNLNRTQVQGEPKVSETLPPDQFGNVLFNRQERARIELAQPRSKYIAGLSYRLSELGVNVRLTRFGRIETYDPANPALDETFSPKVVTDLNVSYRITKNIGVMIGANNLFDVYPDSLQKRQWPTPTNPTSLDNTSFGRFIYSRAATQFGFNGGYYFFSLSANF
ncbi:MAG: TonB-dependent receptor [Bernardetiaceae bacterium]|nr:TonB-dependent receptor [Bernardetiaceae bacterium]